MTKDQVEALEALRQRFLARSAGDLEQLRGHLAGRELPDKELRLLVHRLAGAAGTFGYPDLGDVARDIDGRMGESVFLPEDVARLASALDRLPLPADRVLETRQIP